MSFNGKVVVVTGASSGVGAATAVLFAKRGADVAIVARTQAKLAAVAKQIESHGKKALIVLADLSKEAEAATVIPKVIKHFGKLDVLVNNAGIMVEGNLLDGKILPAYDKVFATNVRAVIQLTSLAAPHLIKTKGNVINISSGAALRPINTIGLTPYFVSKATLDHFTRCASVELAASGVRVNTVNPGPVDNDFITNNGWSDAAGFKAAVAVSTLQGFIASNEDIGEVILFLASDKARSVTGANYVMDNGWTLKN